MRAVEARLRTERARLELAAVRRQRRMLATYDGARRDRRDKDWIPPSTTADSAIIPDHPMLLARTRALIRDNPHAQSIKRSKGRNVVGRGITAAATARDAQGRERTAWNEAADAVFDAWANDPAMCDVEGQKTFGDFQLQAVEQRAEAGEYLVVMAVADNGPGAVPFRLQAVEPEQLDMLMLRSPETGLEVRGGVEIDEYGRPVAYWIHQRPPHDLAALARQLGRATRIPADRVIHYYRQDRPGQTRGVTEYAPALRKLRDLAEYDGLELWQARMQACMGVGIERPAGTGGARSPMGLAGSSDTETDEDGNRNVVFRPGMVFEGLPGEELKFYTPNRPGGQYDPFVKAQLRSIAAAVGLSYEQVARDFSQGNFSSQRQALLEDRREWRVEQQSLKIRFCERIRRRVIRLAVMAGVLNAADYFRDESRYLACEWQPDGWEWIDPSKQAAAAKLMLDNYLATYGELLNEQGKSTRAVFRGAADENAMAESLGITLPRQSAGVPVSEQADDVDDVEDVDDDDDVIDPDTDPVAESVMRSALGRPLAEAIL